MSIHELTEKPTFGERIGGTDFTAARDKLGEIDSALADALENYVFGDVFANCKLDTKEIELCVIASLVVQNHAEQLDFHFSAARRLDVSLKQIYGVIVHCIPFAGWPKGVAAIKAFRSWLDRNGLTFSEMTISEVYGQERPDFRKLGEENGGKIYADYPSLESAVAGFQEGLDRYVTEGIFGRFYGRNDLTLRLRQLTAVAILTSLGRLPQLESHIKGARLVGCSGSEVSEVIKLMHLYAGWPAALNALVTLKNC